MTKASAPAPSCPRVRALLRCAVVLCALLALAPTPEPTPAELESLVAASVDPRGPGVAVGIARGGVLVFEGYRGLADLSGSVPITAATRFDLASVSKQFTAMSILVLRGDGALSLEDDVATYLPELVAERGMRPPRLADLLAMRSGLPDYLEVVETWELLRRWRNETVLAVVAGLPRTRPPGLRTIYSNTNYALLALVVERVSRQPFAELVRSRLFEPLGMHDSVVLDTPGQVVAHRAHGYDGGSPLAAPSECDTGVVGDGQVFTTVRDLAL